MSMINLEIENSLFVSEANVLGDLQWGSLSGLSFHKGEEVSKVEKGVPAPLDRFFSLVNFQREVYERAQQMSAESWLAQLSSVSVASQSAVRAHFARHLALRRAVASEKPSCLPNVLADDDFIDFSKEISSLAWPSLVFPGTNPDVWPQGLNELLDKLQALPPLALWLDPFDQHFEFFNKAKEFIRKDRTNREDIVKAVKVLLLLGLLTGNGSKLTAACLEAIKFSELFEPQVAEDCAQICRPHILLISQVLNTEAPLHYVKPGSMVGRFSVAHMGSLLKKQNSSNTSITTDGQFLYLFAGNNLLKIGTGEGSVCGKVYLSQFQERSSDGAWVFCKGKLYLRTSSRESGILTILCPQTFKTEGILQLHCPELFGDAQKQAVNKNFRLLSDGDYLYIVGMKLETLPEEEQKEGEPKNLCLFTLYKFDLSISGNLVPGEISEQTKELYEGFSCYFSLSECQRALTISNNDIEAAAAWLVEKGDKEKDKKTAFYSSKVILTEAEVISSNLSRLQKPEIILHAESLLTPDHLHRGMWTMNKDNVTVQMPNPDGISSTARIFSTHTVRRLPKNAHLPSQSCTTGLWEMYNPSKQELSFFKGSHIANRNCDTNTEVDTVLCYDISHGRFYSVALNWQAGIHCFVYADQSQLRDKIAVETIDFGPSKIGVFVADCLNLVQMCETNKFNLPWKCLRWTTFYEKMVQKITKILKNTTEEAKISAYQKSLELLQARLEGLQFKEESTALKELGLQPINEESGRKKGDPRIFSLDKKAKSEVMNPASDSKPVKIFNSRESLLCLESSIHTLEILLEHHVDKRLLQLLYLWSTHACCVIPQDLKERLTEVLLSAVHSEDAETAQLAWKTLIIGWKMINTEPEDELRWFELILEFSVKPPPLTLRKDSFLYQIKQKTVDLSYETLHKGKLGPLAMWFICHASSRFSLDRQYKSATEDLYDLLVDKQEEAFTLAKASAVMLSPRDVPLSSPVDRSYLLTRIWDRFADSLLLSIEDPSSLETYVLIEVFLHLVQTSENVPDKLIELIECLIEKLLVLMDKKVTSLYAKWLEWIFKLFQLCMAQQPSSFSRLLSVFYKLRSLFVVEGVDILQELGTGNLVGIDPTQARTFETKHPYQNGKQQLKEILTFPEAIAFCVEFDPQSYTESAQDYLLLSSPNSNSNPETTSVGSFFKLSGPIGAREWVFVQGNQINIEFNASGPSDESLNNWGVKFTVKPVYGESTYTLRDPQLNSKLNKAALIFGGEAMLMQWVSALQLLIYSMSIQIPRLFEVPENSHIKDWQLFRGGLHGLDTSEFVSKSGEEYVLNSEIEVPATKESISALIEGLPEQHKNALLELERDNSHLHILLKQIRRLEPEPIAFRAEQARRSFNDKSRRYWKTVELTGLYVMLFHTNSLEPFRRWLESQTTNEENITKRLFLFGKQLNAILSHMLKEAHLEKEKAQICEDLHELRQKILNERAIDEEGKTASKKKIATEISDQDKALIFSTVSERLKGNKDLTKRLCESLGIEPNIQELLETLWRTDTKSNDPYLASAESVHYKELVLLYFNPHIKLSVSSKKGNPLQELTKFLNGRSWPVDVISEVYLHYSRAASKLVGLQRTLELMKATKSTPFSVLSAGVLPSPKILSNAECCGPAFVTLINQKASEIFRVLVHNVNEVTNRFKQARDQSISKELRLLTCFLHNCYVLMNDQESVQGLLAESDVEGLVRSLLRGLNMISSQNSSKLYDEALAGFNLLLFKVIGCCSSLTSIVKVITDVIKKEPAKEALLMILYEALFSCGVPEDSRTELSQFLSTQISQTKSPWLLRTLCKVAKLVFAESPPSQNTVEALLETIGTYANKHTGGVQCGYEYSVILHSADDQLAFLFPVLLEWESRYPSNIEHRNFDEESPKDQEPQWIEDFLIGQFGFVPSELADREIPQLYRYLNMERSYRSSYRGAMRRRPRVLGSSSALVKLERVFDEQHKNFEDVKDDDSPQERTRKTNEKAFIRRIKNILRECMQLANSIVARGYAQVGQRLSLERAQELATLLRHHQEHLLIDAATGLPLLPPNIYSLRPPPEPKVEETRVRRLAQVSLYEANVARKIEAAMEAGAGLASDSLTGQTAGPYSRPLHSQPIESGHACSYCISDLVSLLHCLAQVEAWRQPLANIMVRAFPKRPGDFAKADALGALIVLGGWIQCLRPGAEVAISINSRHSRGTIIQETPPCFVIVLEDDPYCEPQSIEMNSVSPAACPTPPEVLGITPTMAATALLAAPAGRETQLVLKLCSRMDWEQWVISDDPLVPGFVQKILSLDPQLPAREDELQLAWEQLIDQQQQLFLAEDRKAPTLSSEGFMMTSEEPNSLSSYSLPLSAYHEFPPTLASPADARTFKMLKYWEKYIIPKVQEYVRSSFRTYEMEYYFEQVREPLRSGDQQKAIDIIFVLCDQRLPNGIVIPDNHHDWNALMVDEVLVGAQVRVNLKPELLEALDCPILSRLRGRGVTQFPATVRACDARALSLLIEYTENAELHLLWIPISCVYPAVPAFPSCPRSFTEALEATTGVFARQTILQCLGAPGLDLQILIRTAVLEELPDPIKGWKHCRDFIPTGKAKPRSITNCVYLHHSKPSPNLKRIQEMLPSTIAEAVELTVIAWHQLAEAVSESAFTIDIVEITTQLMGQQQPLQSLPENIIGEKNIERKYFPLHPSQSSYAGLALSFKKDAFMCSNSTLKFYSDPHGQNLIHQITAGINGKRHLAPITFKTGKVWCTFYTFVDIKCNRYFVDFAGPSVLVGRVHGIPQEWSMACWATEELSRVLCENPNPDSISYMHSLTFSVTEFISNSYCSSALRQLLFRMLIRLVRRLRFMNSTEQTSLGISEDWLYNLITETTDCMPSEALYSSYMQDFAELVATCMLPWDINGPAEPQCILEVPEWIQSMYKTLLFVNFFRGEGNLTPELETEIQDTLKHDQWKFVIVLQSLPPNSRDSILTILGQYKLRIPDIDTDVQFIDQNCVIFGDGLSLQTYQETDFGEEEKSAHELEEDSKETEGWECGICTYVNNPTLASCEMCMTPRPASVQVPAAAKTDIRAIDSKIASNQSEALNELLRSLRGIGCQAHLLEDQHNSLLEKALQQRLTHEGKLRGTLEEGFDGVWQLLRDLLGEDYHLAKESMLQQAATDSIGLFKALESRGVDLWLQNSLGCAPRRMSTQQAESLIDLVEFKMCQETRAVLYVPPSFIRLPSERFSGLHMPVEFPSSTLSHLSLKELRYNWGALKVFNRYVSESIGLCNLSELSVLPADAIALSLASGLSEIRSLVMLPVKTELQQIVFTSTAISRENTPQVTLERLSGNSQLSFYSAFEQLKDANPEMLRPVKPQGADPFIAFVVNLKGELVLGEAGPYRQFFTDISKELQAYNSEFLIPAPNESEKEVANKFVINPSCKHTQMFEFLGLLMGCCARTGTKMPLDLPSYFWKPLVGQSVTFQDLENIDSAASSKFRTIENAKPEYFEEVYEFFVAKLSDSSTVEIIPEGSSVPLNFDNKGLYVKKALYARFLESKVQAEHIRRGLSKVVPLSLLNLCTWKQLEEWVCGKPTVDIELLRRHTKLGGGLTPNDNRVVWLWEILHELPPTEQVQFIKFCWAQERLPVNDEDFEATNTRFMLKPAMNSEYGDGALPKADTCFFNLELHAYSSKEVMKERLRYAFLTDCIGLNGDSPVNEQQEAGMFGDQGYPEEEF